MTVGERPSHSGVDGGEARLGCSKLLPDAPPRGRWRKHGGRVEWVGGWMGQWAVGGGVGARAGRMPRGVHRARCRIGLAGSRALPAGGAGAGTLRPAVAAAPLPPRMSVESRHTIRAAVPRAAVELLERLQDGRPLERAPLAHHPIRMTAGPLPPHAGPSILPGAQGVKGRN